MPSIWFFAFLFLASTVATLMVRLVALKGALIDVPNERSSHLAPVPRGGGVAIFICFSAASYFLGSISPIPWYFVASLLAGGVLVTAIGFVDDFRSLSPGVRLIGQFAAAGLALYLIGGMPPVPLFGQDIDFGWIGHALALIGLVWLINLYNFMDGINGIAAVEAVTIGLAAGLTAYAGNVIHTSILPLSLAAAAAGFLIWNFPIARIFMGDSGSGYLGLMIGVLAIQSGHVDPTMLWCWLILLGCFVVDSSVTLFRRILRGHRPHDAHRNHAYQFASRRFNSHAKITIAVAAINLIWLAPISIMVAVQKLSGLVGLAIAYIPLFLLALYFRAGTEETKNTVADTR